MKKIIIVLLIIILVPLVIIAGLYFTLDPAKKIVNNILSDLPGPVGENFSSMPTDYEIEQKINDVAEYLLDLEFDRALDKLIIAETDDKKIFDMLIKQMNRLDPNKTAKLLDEMREIKTKESQIIATIEKIKQEETEDAKMFAEYLTGLNLPSQVEAVKSILDEDADAYKYLAAIFENMEDSTVIKILALLEKGDKNGIIERFEPEKGLEYKKKLNKNDVRIKEISDISKMLKKSEAEDLASILAEGSKYTEDEIVQIFSEIGAKQTGEVLAKINNSEYTEKMITSLKEKQIVEKGADTFTENVIDSLNIYKEYADKMDELVSIYKELGDDEIAKMVRTLYWSTGISKTYGLNNGEEIVISDEDLALDLLRSFPSKKIASILSYLDNRIASDIFTKLALPKP